MKFHLGVKGRLAAFRETPAVLCISDFGIAIRILHQERLNYVKGGCSISHNYIIV